MIGRNRNKMYTVAIFLLLTITSTTVAYRDGARNDSCYGHEVVHLTFGVAALPTVCTDPCSYTLTVVNKVGNGSIEEGITTYECNETYLLNVNYSRNAFEGFLVQARNVNGTFNENSSIYGTFLEDESFLYKPLMCGVNMFDESEVFPNSATQKVPVNEESFVPMYWRAPDPVEDINQLPDSLTFWFTIVQQQQTYFFPIEGPTLVRDDVTCTIPTPPEPTTPETTESQTTQEETSTSTTVGVTDQSTTGVVTDQSTTDVVTDQSTTDVVTVQSTPDDVRTSDGGRDLDSEVRTAIGIGVGIALPLFVVLIVLIVVAVYLGVKYFSPTTISKKQKQSFA